MSKSLPSMLSDTTMTMQLEVGYFPIAGAICCQDLVHCDTYLASNEGCFLIVKSEWWMITMVHIESPTWHHGSHKMFDGCVLLVYLCLATMSALTDDLE